MDYQEGQMQVPTEQLGAHRRQTKGTSSLEQRQRIHTFKILISIRIIKLGVYYHLLSNTNKIYFQSFGVPAENTKTNTPRGRPQIYIDLLAKGRPRMTGLVSDKQLVDRIT